MFKKTIAFILVLIATVSVLVSCTNSGNSDVNSSKNSSAVSESATATSKEASSSASVSDETSSEESSVDMATLINDNLDIILADVPEQGFAYNKTESTLAEIFADEFSVIVDLGEEAFPILDGIYDDSENAISRRAMARYAKYIINPDLYDLSYPSPDSKYTIKCSVFSFVPVYASGELRYCDFRLVDKTTGSTLAMSDINEIAFIITWSDDSKYAALSYGDQKYYYKTDVFDALNGRFIELPGIDEILDSLEFDKELMSTKLTSYFKEWVSDNKIKIEVLIGDVDNRIVGWYIYDLTDLKIVDDQLEAAEG
ncbi:MAG: hypothetical protein PHV95_01415 [Eubacteriales bacterium]|nr:hypothetical protein [Eubacteriales bacterium]